LRIAQTGALVFAWGIWLMAVGWPHDGGSVFFCILL
jgi:hypothetical protein